MNAGVTAGRLVEVAIDAGYVASFVRGDPGGPAWVSARALAAALDGVALDDDLVRHLAWQIGWGTTALAEIITAARAT